MIQIEDTFFDNVESFKFVRNDDKEIKIMLRIYWDDDITGSDLDQIFGFARNVCKGNSYERKIIRGKKRR